MTKGRFATFRNVVVATVAPVVVISMALPVLAFDDVPDGHTFEADVEWLAQTGITRGCNPPDNTRFCPDDDVTRGAMAAFLVRALGLTDSGPTFEDTDGHLFEGDISRLAAAGITRGCNPPDNTRFCPDDPVTRGQMAAFLHRALGDDGGGNGLIAFVSDRHDGDLDIFVMKPDGSGVENLTADSPAADHGPAWSPDGSKIAFVIDRDGEDDIFVMDADGANPVNLTADQPGRSDDPSFSPDGSRIVFSGYRNGHSAIYHIDADDGGNLAVYDVNPDSNPFYFNPTLSPDGELMGFTYSFVISPADFLMWTLSYPDPSDPDPRAGEPVPNPILDGPKLFQDFSPDGARVLFGAISGEGDFDLFSIRLEDAGTTDYTNLTSTPIFREGRARYSPDGSQIVFSRSPAEPCCDEPGDVFVMTTDGGFPTNLSRHPADDFAPAWQPVS